MLGIPRILLLNTDQKEIQHAINKNLILENDRCSNSNYFVYRTRGSRISGVYPRKTIWYTKWIKIVYAFTVAIVDAGWPIVVSSAE